MENINEIWKPVIIDGIDTQYMVSNIGNFKSLERMVYQDKRKPYLVKERVLKLGKLKNERYYKITFSINGVTKCHQAHRLVAIAFIPNVDNLRCVNHINGVGTDNRVENLEWVNYRENNTHTHRNKTSSKYTGVRKSKYNTWYAILQIKKKSTHLGAFRTEDLAYKAYLKALSNNGIKNKYAPPIEPIKTERALWKKPYYINSSNKYLRSN